MITALILPQQTDIGMEEGDGLCIHSYHAVITPVDITPLITCSGYFSGETLRRVRHRVSACIQLYPRNSRYPRCVLFNQILRHCCTCRGLSGFQGMIARVAAIWLLSASLVCAHDYPTSLSQHMNLKSSTLATEASVSQGVTHLPEPTKLYRMCYIVSNAQINYYSSVSDIQRCRPPKHAETHRMIHFWHFKGHSRELPVTEYAFVGSPLMGVPRIDACLALIVHLRYRTEIRPRGTASSHASTVILTNVLSDSKDHSELKKVFPKLCRQLTPVRRSI